MTIKKSSLMKACLSTNGIIQNAPLKELEIGCAPDMSHVRWLTIFTALQIDPKCRLVEELILISENIKEATRLSLSNVILHNTATLKTLDLVVCIKDVTIASGVPAFNHSGPSR